MAQFWGFGWASIVSFRFLLCPIFIMFPIYGKLFPGFGFVQPCCPWRPKKKDCVSLFGPTEVLCSWVASDFKGLTEVRRQPFTGHDEVHSRDCASLLGRLTEVSIEVSS